MGVAGALVLAGHLGAQGVTATDRARAHHMLNQIRDQLKASYYDSTFHGVDLDAKALELGAQIDSAKDIGEVIAAIADLPFALQDSHTMFLPPDQTVSVDYGWYPYMVGDSCYVSSVTPGSDAQKRGVARGDRLITINGYVPTRQNLWQLQWAYWIRKQASLHVRIAAPGGPERELDLAATVRRESQKIMQRPEDQDVFQDDPSKRVERARAFRWIDFGSSAEVWRLTSFLVDDRAIRDGLRRAHDHQALIIDLRRNPGGYPAALAQLLDGLTSITGDTLGVFKGRRSQTPFIVKGRDGAFKGQIIVLMNSFSTSASEIFARSIQLLHRGIVMGDRSGGAVMSGHTFQYTLGDEVRVYYGLEVTVADYIAADGRRLEGAGVTPDSLVLPTGDDLAHDRDPVLSRALAMVGISVSPDSAGKLRWKD